MRIAARVAAATVGSYAVTAGSAALLALMLISTAELARSDALIVGSCIGYLLFTAMMLWCVAERRLSRVWLVIFSGSAATHGTVMLIERG